MLLLSVHLTPLRFICKEIRKFWLGFTNGGLWENLLGSIMQHYAIQINNQNICLSNNIAQLYFTHIRESQAALEIFQYTQGWLWYSEIFQQEVFQWEAMNIRGHPQVNWKCSNITRLSLIQNIIMQYYFDTNVWAIYLCFQIYFLIEDHCKT